MNRRLKLSCLALGLVMGVSSKLLSQQFTPFDFPGSTFTTARDINPAGQIVGRYGTADNRTHGYLRSQAGVFTSIDYPGGNLTAALGISPQGDVVGAVRFPGEPGPKRHAFLLSNGTFSTFDFPGAASTSAAGMNSRGDIVGIYTSADKTIHGFLLSEGVYTAIDFPGARETHAWKITTQRRILGGYVGDDSGHHDFILSEGEFTTVDLPQAPVPTLDTGGINNHDDIAGWYCDTTACAGAGDIHGFLLLDGEFTTVEVAGFTCVTPLAINSQRDVVGAYSTNAACTDLHGFLMTDQRERDNSNK
jgi:uncharacterized membrane protein